MDLALDLAFCSFWRLREFIREVVCVGAFLFLPSVAMVDVVCARSLAVIFKLSGKNCSNSSEISGGNVDHVKPFWCACTFPIDIAHKTYHCSKFASQEQIVALLEIQVIRKPRSEPQPPFSHDISTL